MNPRKSLIFFLVLSMLLACNPATLATTTPTPSASATPLPPTPTNTPRPTITASATVTPTEAVPQSHYLVKIEARRNKMLGADYGGTIVYDKASKLLGIINDDFRMVLTAGETDLNLEVTTYNSSVSDADLMAIAEAKYPKAKVKFWARPNFSLSNGWSNMLPANWDYAKVPNYLLKRNDYFQDTLEDPRTTPVLNWMVLQVTCKPYTSDPGEGALPDGVRWDKLQMYQFLILKEAVDLKVICGNRDDGVDTAWANQFSLLGKNHTDVERDALMADALTWMLSKGKTDQVQDELIGGTNNFARFIVGHDGISGWQTLPEVMFGKGG